MKKSMYEFFYLLYYSVKDIFTGMGEGLIEFKKPRTWLAVLIAAALLIVYSGRTHLMYWVLPPIIIIYVVRQKIAGHYKHEIRIKALKKNRDLLLVEEYNKYVKNCHYAKKAPLGYEDWKDEERKKID